MAAAPRFSSGSAAVCCCDCVGGLLRQVCLKYQVDVSLEYFIARVSAEGGRRRGGGGEPRLTASWLIYKEDSP
ncbi:hypothetical protein E2C01_009087 [Portunus trituberculatus]|uniref:Uncharacterized protein n=1 Tax=Portunus trituberculatus TaxID=210409 RepID=A0A5B7D2I6_PORTR|nr:hypothetical protein [Portunus trituberculatus]